MEPTQLARSSANYDVNEFGSVTSERFDARTRNAKIINFITTRKRPVKGSSECSKLPDKCSAYLDQKHIDQSWLYEWLSCLDQKSQVDLCERWQPLTYIWTDYSEYEVFASKSIKEIIEARYYESIIDKLDVNKWVVKEYTTGDALKVLHSILDVGKEIFDDSRPRTEMEARAVNSFFNKKARTIHYKELKEKT